MKNGWLQDNGHDDDAGDAAAADHDDDDHDEEDDDNNDNHDNDDEDNDDEDEDDNDERVQLQMVLPTRLSKPQIDFASNPPVRPFLPLHPSSTCSKIDSWSLRSTLHEVNLSGRFFP